MAKRTYTQEQRDEALKLYETDGPSKAAKATGIPKGTLAGWAKAAGVRTGRNQNAHARVEAAQVDAKALRAELEVMYLEEAKRMLQKMREPSLSVSAGQVVVTEEPTPDGYRNLMTTSGTALDKSLVVRDADGDNGMTAATSVLERMISALGIPDE